MSRRVALCCALLLALPAAFASPASDRFRLHGQGPSQSWTSTGMSEAAFLSMNVLLGGLTAGVLQGLRGGSFQDGFTRGSLGGGVVYVGKRVSVESFPGAGLVGREVAAVGSSVVRNASEGRPSLESVVFPLGPLRFHLTPGAARPLHAKLDLMDGYWIVYGLVDSRLELDLEESLSAGIPVFRASEWGLASRNRRVGGLAVGGVVFLSPEARPSTLPHEIVHVIQHDFAHRAWTEPLDHWLAGRLPWEGFRHRLDYDFTFPVLRWGAGWILGDDVYSPWESEARFLGERKAEDPVFVTRGTLTR